MPAGEQHGQRESQQVNPLLPALEDHSGNVMPQLQQCPWGATPFLSYMPKALDEMKAVYQRVSLPSAKLSSALHVTIAPALLPAHPMPAVKALT